MHAHFLSDQAEQPDGSLGLQLPHQKIPHKVTGRTILRVYLLT
jgi:hypothetical protein